MRKFYPKFLALIIVCMTGFWASAQVSVTATAGTPGPTAYTTVKAAFDAINAGTHQGNISVTITASTTETAAAVLNRSGAGAASYTSVLVKPAAATTPTISGVIASSLIDLNGANNVTIDGSNAVSGTTKDLTISNTDAAGSALRFIEGASNNVVKYAVLKGAAATEGTAVLHMSTSNAATGNNNNLIQNNDITKSTTSPFACIYNSGSPGKANTGNIYRNNRLIDFQRVGFMDGIGTVGYSSNTLVEGNEIFQTTAQVTELTGILIDGPVGISNMTISKNHIHDLLTNVADVVTGIDLYDAVSVTVVNNFVSLNVPTSTVLLGIIQETDAGSTVKIYYNTVSIYGTTSGGNISFALLKNYFSTGDEFRNNILSNTRLSSGTGAQYAIGNVNSGTFTSNYNDLVSTGNPLNVVGRIGATNYATITEWRTATGQDINSVSVAPVFVSATNLHLVPASNPGLDNLGIALAGFTTDYDGETRNATTPDMGADEFTGSGGDVTAPTILYTPLLQSCTTGDRSLSATINDVGGIPTTGILVPRIYYKKSSGSTWYSSAGTLASGTGNSGTWNFTITAADMGGLAVGDNVQYYIIAQDNAGSPNIASIPSGVVATNVNTVTTHPATPNSYPVSGSLSGNYTVGSGGNYANLTAAVNAYNAGCLTGPVTFLLTDATYNEAGAITIAANPTSSATNKLTIRPANGITSIVTATVSGPFIRILGSNVTIDGHNSVSNRNLTIVNNGTTSPNVVVIGSTGTTPITNVTLDNAIFINGANTSSALVVSDGTTAGSAGYSSAIRIQNNSIQKAYIGVYVNQVATGTNGNGLIISSNNLNATGANAIRLVGIYVQGVNGASINSNIIGNFDGTNDENDRGIWLASGTNASIVESNTITNLNYTGTAGFAGQGIIISSAVANANIRVANNMIAGISGDGWTFVTNPTDNPIGIGLSGTQGGIGIYFNSIHLSGNTLNQANAMSMGLFLGTGSTAAVVDNIIVNNLGLLGATGYGSAGIYAVVANTQFSSINYNNYYVNPTGSGAKFIGQIAAAGSATLAAWQTASGGDAASKNVLPVFTSATNLHLATSGNDALNNAGTPVIGVLLDIDNESRSLTTPDIGADEFAAAACVAPVITVQPAPQTACAGSPATFSVTATGTSLAYQWRKNGTNITSANAASYVIAAPAAADAANYDVVVSNSCGTATSTAVALTVNALPAITTQPSSQAACTGGSVTFSVAATGAGLTYQWRKDGNPIASATNNSYTINSVAASDAGTYTVVVSGTCTPSVTSSGAVLTLASTNVWTGVTSTNWATPSNWCSGVPTATSDITIPSGTPFSPSISTTQDVRNLTINSGATVTVAAGGRLNLYGNFANAGTMTATAGTVAFQGTANQTVATLNAGTVIMNGAGGITLGGNMVVGTTLTLTSGNITLGTNNITLNGSATGSAGSHIITNGTGSVISNNITTTDVTIPVGPDATSYNPVTINNGGGRNFTVRVATGITPTIANPTKAINRTWNISPSTALTSNATLTFQYADAEANSGATGSALMEVGVHTGTAYAIASPATGVTPTGTAAARLVTIQTVLTGPTVITNPGGITYPLAIPGIDPDLTQVQLMPNLVQDNTLLRIQARRSTRINWTITDMQGRVVMQFDTPVTAGQNDVQLKLGQLSAGSYQLNGRSTRGGLPVIRLVRVQ